jgi:DNA-binding transcriptional LysR family regulator
MRMRLDLSLVEIFCCVYEEGSFSKAAQRLRLSQPTISGHIKNLEQYIGAKLFDRLPRRIVPTRAGQLLYRHGRLILNEKEAAIQALKKFLNRIEGPLAISSSTIPGEYLLPQIIASFHHSFPKVRVELEIADSEAACRAVLDGKAELGFAGARLDACNLELRHFASDDLVLVAPNNNRWRRVKSITLDQLAGLPFLAREPGSGTRQAFEKKIGRSLDNFNLVGCFGSTGAIKEALKAGLGLSVLSLLAVKFEVKSGQLKIVEIEGIGPIQRDFFTVVNRSLTLSPIAEAFLAFAIEGSTKQKAFFLQNS